ERGRSPRGDDPRLCRRDDVVSRVQRRGRCLAARAPRAGLLRVTDASAPSPAARTDLGARIPELLPGLILAVVLATGAFLVADLPWVRNTLHVSALLLVILFGMLGRSVFPIPAAATPGLRMAQRPILRWAVAGLGFRL